MADKKTVRGLLMDLGTRADPVNMGLLTAALEAAKSEGRREAIGNSCPVCAGQPVSKKPCICDGTGAADIAYLNLLMEKKCHDEATCGEVAHQLITKLRAVGCTHGSHTAFTAVIQAALKGDSREGAVDPGFDDTVQDAVRPLVEALNGTADLQCAKHGHTEIVGQPQIAGGEMNKPDEGQYVAKVTCNNCGYQGQIIQHKGTLVRQSRCPKCYCETLFPIKERKP